MAPAFAVEVEAATVVVAVELDLGVAAGVVVAVELDLEAPAGVVVAVELDLEAPAEEVLDGAAVVVALLDLLELVLPAETAVWVVVMEVVVLVVDEVKVWPLT